MRKSRALMDFIREFRLVSVAVGFVIAVAANDLVTSFVNNLIMPFLDPLIIDGTWREAATSIGPFTFNWGPVLASLFNTLILLLLAYLVIKKLLRYSPSH